MSGGPDPGPDRARPRRSSAEVRRLILDAATRLFGERGLVATTTRDIAREAGVAEPLVYRHFGTKDELVRQAVLAPLRELVDTYADGWHADVADDERAPGPPRAVRGLYDVLHARRHLLLALLASDDHGRDGAVPAGGPDPLLADLLAQVEELVARERPASPPDDPEARLAVRFTFATALSMALFGEMMFPPGAPRPTDDEIVAEMGRFLDHASRRGAREGEPRRDGG